MYLYALRYKNVTFIVATQTYDRKDCIILFTCNMQKDHGPSKIESGLPSLKEENKSRFAVNRTVYAN